MEKPFGTFTPFAVSSRTISPSEAFFPPTSGTSSMPVSANHLMNEAVMAEEDFKLAVWGRPGPGACYD